MRSYTLLAVLLVVAVLEPCYGEEGPIVQTSYGPIRGYSFTSTWTGQQVHALTGVPFAAPPTGHLRFQDPEKPESWTDVRDCTQDGLSCIQHINPGLVAQNITFNMSEDCLFLNVYTPQLTPAKGLPVMVWVHGGGFKEGSGSRFRFGPDFLVAEGVVVVTTNYRLGAFGFLSLGTLDIPGNAALKDQRMALLWVQQEIKKFGGDPGLVTLFGESAGSASVHLHYLSPLSKGLFQGVIAESGTALNWGVWPSAPKYGLQLASALNCSTADLSETRKCLLAMSSEEILRGQDSVRTSEGGAVDSLLLAFFPTIDNHSSNPFLPKMPTELVKENQGSSLPIVMGINADEGMLMFLRGDDYVLNITNNLEQFIPKEIREDSKPSRVKLLVDRIKNYYFKNFNSKYDIVRGYVNLYTDWMFGYDTVLSTRLYRHRNPVFLYYFNFNGAFKELLSEISKEMYNYTGVCHAEELNYLFVIRSVNQSVENHPKEMKTWRRLVRMWTNFAKFGTPTVSPDSLLQNVSWRPVGRESNRYLRIDDNLTMVTADFLGPSVFLWDTITSGSRLLNLDVIAGVATVTALIYAAT